MFPTRPTPNAREIWFLAKLLLELARGQGATDCWLADEHVVERVLQETGGPGPARYQFRVLCEAEADFPFAAGVSKVVGVSER